MSSLDNAIQHIALLHNLNLTVVEESSNTLKVVMPLQGNQNHFGGIYAGAIFSLAEFPFGLLCVNRFTKGDIVPVIGEVTIRFLAPAMSALTVELNVADAEWDEIEQQTKMHGKFKIIKELELKDANGKVNSVVKATYFTLLMRK